MAPSNELEHLKSLVAQLNDKINALEAKAKSDVPKTPAVQLRTILIGPPGAGVPTLLRCCPLTPCLTFWNREGDAGS